MKNTITETTRLLLQGKLTKEEADKILLDLHIVSISDDEIMKIAVDKVSNNNYTWNFDNIWDNRCIIHGNRYCNIWNRYDVRTANVNDCRCTSFQKQKITLVNTTNIQFVKWIFTLLFGN